MKAAIYARYSTDLQNDRSIEDQLVLCRGFAAAEGLAVAAEYHDRARSGASLLGRDGLLDLMAAAKAGGFDVVVTESLDRLSRDQEDLAGLFKRLKFLGIEIRAVHGGRADAVQVGVRGLLGHLYLEDLAHKVRRGLAGTVREGRLPGGLAYGYRADPAAPGVRRIVPEEAAAVVRIFEAYAGGDSPRAIAKALNADGVPPPRAARWTASALNGSKARGTGLLACEMYRGRIVWNKVRMVKDPDTGRRVSRPNPPAEWQTAEAPHLRIVSDALWAAVEARRAGKMREGWRRPTRPKHALSGLLKCGACGAGMASKGRDKTGKIRVRCSAATESGSCPAPRAYYLADIEAALFAGLHAELADPRLLQIYLDEYMAERRRLAGDAAAGKARAAQRLGALKREADRLVRAIASGETPAAIVGPRLFEIEREQAEAEQALKSAEAAAGDKIITLHPAALAHYRAAIADLGAALDADGMDRARAALRTLIERVIVHPVPKGATPSLEVHGPLDALLLAPSAPRHLSGGVMVAADSYRQDPRRIKPLFALRFSVA